MLVLSRKPNERILIGDEIELVIVRINRNNVRVGIKAPHGLKIIREELTRPPEPKEPVAA